MIKIDTHLQQQYCCMCSHCMVVCVYMGYWTIHDQISGLNNLALWQIYSTASTVIYQGGRFGDQKSHWQMAIHHTFVRRGVSKCHNLKMVCVKLIHMKDKVGGGWCFFSWKYISEKATLKVFTTIKRDTHLQQHCICWTTVRKAYFVQCTLCHAQKMSLHTTVLYCVGRTALAWSLQNVQNNSLGSNFSITLLIKTLIFFDFFEVQQTWKKP